LADFDTQGKTNNNTTTYIWQK